LTKAWLDKYFHKSGYFYDVRKELKRMILFVKHDITIDPPYLKLDLLLCRNVLIYFSAELQRETLAVFHYALESEGYLFLGKSESIAQKEELFEKIEGTHKIYQKSPGTNTRSYRMERSRSKVEHSRQAEKLRQLSFGESILKKAYEAYFKYQPHPYVIINHKTEILELRGSLRPYAELREGAGNIHLQKMINPELSLELRALLSKVDIEGKQFTSSIIKFQLFNQEHIVRLHACPVEYETDRPPCYLILFEEIKQEQIILNKSDRAKVESDSDYIASLEHELMSTKEHLQLFTEELETSNEELQSLNEELQSTNEELKSTNEELETSNEELQSVNEELHTANQELRATNDELIAKEEALKISNEKTKKSELLYKSIAKNFPNGFICIIEPDFSVSFIEGIELEKIGLDKKNIQGQSVLGLYDFSQHGNLQRTLRPVFNGKSTTTVIKFKDHYYKINAVPLKVDNEITEVMFTMLNITEQKALEFSLTEALKENKILLVKTEEAVSDSKIQQARLHDLVMNAPAAICIIKGPDFI
ncbi:MAG: CheR family methyltransferase, partial [Cyclobacteriaceae bacterium]